MATGSQLGGPTPVLERSVKAAFLYKFLGYMEFPSDPGPTLVVGVLGADELAAELVQITSGRNVGNRAISVRNLRDGDSLAGLHVLFVGADAAQPGSALRAAEKNGTVTVTEQDDGLQTGSVINFRVVDQRVRFEVSLPAAERCNVRLSSRLLSVAYHVQKGGQ
ncbi:YfiR family protein [Pseudoduganella sp. OTU4001]|uniref:YfiR family protein n=1 Tax=Pseudoduganella sp. OTU4001 TaxID=3043854 RepID=UPI00313D5D7C